MTTRPAFHRFLRWLLWHTARFDNVETRWWNWTNDRLLKPREAKWRG